MGQKDTQEKTTAAGGTVAPARLTPIDVQQKEFQVSRLGGYKMRDVDEFLDQITDTFTALTAEIDRLSAGGTSRVVGSPDLDDVARQADEIIARARAEAARITGEARSASSSSPAPAGPHDRDAVNAFISREREFLQSLAGLVQEHAETVKTMAKSTRPPTPRATTAPAKAPATDMPAAMGTTVSSTQPAASATAPRTEESAAAAPSAEASRSTQPPPPAEVQPSTPAGVQPTARAAGAAQPARSEEPAGSAEVPTRVPDSDPTVRIDEPAPAGASRRDTEPEGDRSLRELFWGED
ncbi:hypothetical protein BH18ACT17_BH18ACT17_10280 [soil metagenome]